MKRTPPAEILLYEFMVPLYAILKGMSPKWLEKFLNGEIVVDEDVAKYLSYISGTTPEFWLNLQRRWDEEAANAKT